MNKGIIYVMSTVVPGLIKIGRTGSENFEQRMYNLERNGYFNVVGLKREFAIEVDNYDEKEKLLDDIFSKSQVPNSELFALDIELVIQLLSSFDGKQIYPSPSDTTKEEIFTAATKERNDKIDRMLIPDGEYYLSRKTKTNGLVTATMRVENGTFIVLKGCTCHAPQGKVWECRKNAPIVNGILIEDYPTSSPSAAGYIVLGQENNGWTTWKDKNGNTLDIFRQKRNS